MLTSRRFLEYVSDPRREAHGRRAQITHEAAKILPVRDDSESWRVTERIWHVARRLTQLRCESLLWGAPVRDAHYNLLRFIELPDLILDDRLDDYGIIRPAALHHDDHPIPDDRAG
jgi:hypothetical protein